MAVVAPIVSTFVPKGVIDAEKAFKNLKKTLVSALGTAAFLQFGKASIAAAEDAKRSAARIRNIAQQAGYANGELDKVTNRLLEYAQATAKATGVDDDQVAAIQAKLLAFKSLAATAGNLGDTFDRTTKAALDLAAAGFGDAEGNATLLAKALENPTKGLTKLERAIGPLTDAQRKNIDTLLQQNDLYGAQQALLAAVEGRVGGTAEATASASDKLRVTFDQLAESVGNAVLPTFEQLVAAFGKVVDVFTSLPAGLQKFIVIGLGLVVVLKKIRTALVALKVEASTANVVIAGLAVATELYFALFGDNTAEAKASIAGMASEMAGMTDETLLAVDANNQLVASIKDLSRRDYFKELVRSSPEVARRLLDLYIKTGKSKDQINDLAVALYDYEQAAGISAQTTADFGDEAYKAANGGAKSLWRRLGELTGRIAEQGSAYRDALTAKLEYFNSDLAAAAAQRDVITSLADYNTLIASIKDGTYDGTNAFLDAAAAQDQFYQSALESAAAQAELAKAQGDTRSATEVQIAELERVRDTLGPNDPLRQRLNQYIASLKLIPTSIQTKIQADITAALTGFTFNRFSLSGTSTKRAAGGPVMEGMPYTVGEVGPELFVPRQSGTIIPNSRLATAGRAPANGPVYNITVTGAIDAASTARQIRQLLQQDGRRLGLPTPVPA